MTNQLHSTQLTDIYARRFSANQPMRAVLWSTLVERFFQRYIRPQDTVLDLAAGYCDFINHVSAARRVAVDLNPEVRNRAAEGVEVFLARSTELPAELRGACDVVFVSNFFEHLDSKHEFLATLAQIRDVLTPGGQLLILQPNLRLLGSAYWDFIDHSLPITDRSMREALELSGLRITEQRTRFLPYTANSGLPVRAVLIRAYLALKPAQWLLGKQTFVVAQRADPPTPIA
jgi:SAM-dependent methyltransferase